MLLDSIIQDVRYALRGIRRAPLFAGSVAATIGLGLGVLGSAFTVVNAYILRPIDLPNPYALYALSWDAESSRHQRFRLSDFEAFREGSPHFSALIAGEEASVMQNGAPIPGFLVTGNYFQALGARPAIGRLLTPEDAVAPGQGAVVVLSNNLWRSRYGADPAIVGQSIVLGRQRFDVVGVTPPGYGMLGEESIGFWAPLTMARAFGATDPWSDASTPSLFVIGRLREGGTEAQARAWLDQWLRQRFPAGSDLAPVAVQVDSRATHILLNGRSLTLTTLVVSAFALVLLVACANVTNLMLARALQRHREISVRLSLGATRLRIARQLAIESLVLAVPAAAVGLALTAATARVFPAIVVATFPRGLLPVESMLLPLDPDVRVMTLLFAAAVVATVLVSVAPAVRVTRANLAHASKGDTAFDTRRSRLRTGLVALQIGACALFLIGAAGLVDESRHVANADAGLNYARVASVRVDVRIRANVATHLASDPSVERVAAAWQPPLVSPLQTTGMVASETNITRAAGFIVVSPDYFPLFDLRITRGRAFTTQEADDNAAVVLVSEATAQAFWPGRDPIGQTLTLVPGEGRSQRRPSHTSVRVIGVAHDVTSGTLLDGTDTTCVYFATGFRSPGELSLLVRGRADVAPTKTAVTAAVTALDPDAAFQFYTMREFMGAITWVLQAISVGASLIGSVGLLLAFSGTYAVVAFLVTQRMREFGIRMALGATVRQIVSGLLRETLRTASIGIGGGVMVSLALVLTFRAAFSVVPAFAVRPYAVGIGIVFIATMTAALFPSLRAARTDPSRALRVD